jgi:phospholipid/cholesterol/gamma-HCH transport system permease protein
MKAAFEMRGAGRERALALQGDWTVWTVAAVDAPLRKLGAELGPGVNVDVTGLGHIDMTGAWLIDRTVRGGEPCANMDAPLTLIGRHEGAERLLRAARAATQPCPLAPSPVDAFGALLDRAGAGLLGMWREGIALMDFFGRVLVTLAGLIAHPKKIRWTSIVHAMEHAGLNAFPIVMLLSFFIGFVVAYLGAVILADFGATVFTVELVAFSMMREFAAVITAVILAGRSNSAFTAEIGVMKMRQEIDAMQVMGLEPMATLVAPRVIALMIMLPLLTFAAMVSGLAGGLLVCWRTLGVSPVMFLARMQEIVPVQHFWAGMVKTPFFAMALALIACRHGLAVGGDVASLGQRTTSSVVQAIFVVIVIDALFALWFVEMNW